jgi:hypothetical protein
MVLLAKDDRHPGVDLCDELVGLTGYNCAGVQRAVSTIGGPCVRVADRDREEFEETASSLRDPHRRLALELGTILLFFSDDY